MAFTPPRIPVAEAGLLVDGQVDTRETAATIIDLAVRGALTVQSTGEDDFRVTLVDPEPGRRTARDGAADQPVRRRAAGRDDGPVGPGQPGHGAHQTMRDSVRNQVASRGWFRKVPSASRHRQLRLRRDRVRGLPGAFAVGAWVLWLLVPLLPILITFAVIRFKLRRGQRTADGRAVCDQVEGFKTYLATAEADQLRFEEGEDIFSKYLPWAIIFELADRWAKICGDLVAMGRLPDATPYWYVGNYHIAAFNTGFLTSSLTSAADPGALGGQQRQRLRRRQLVRRRRVLRRRWRRGRQRQLVSDSGPLNQKVSATLDQVDDEDQRLARLDHAAGAAVPVGQVRRDDQLPAAADLHAGHARVPARRSPGRRPAGSSSGSPRL